MNPSGPHDAPLPSSTAIPLFDMQRQYAELKSEILSAIGRVCDSGKFVLGPECEAFEQEAAAYCGTPVAVACASGSDALLLALMAYGVGAGDEVIVPSFTFFATASSVWRLGAKPVFADIDPRTFNLDPAAVEAVVTTSTKAVIPVHLYGQCAEMGPLLKIAERSGLAVIEDAAQAIGAEYRGQRAGSIGHVGCLSFYPTKNLGGAGDGGMLTTHDAILADKLRLLRGHGMRPRYYHQVVGINSRLDSLQAAILRVKLPHLDRWTRQRQANAARYGELFAACGLDQVLVLPAAAPNRRHVWNQYVIRVPQNRRDALREHLAQRTIGTEIYYPLALHEQQCFQSLEYMPGSMPETERAARDTLALPIFPELTADEQECVVRCIAEFFGQSVSARQTPVKKPKYLELGRSIPQ